MAAAHNLLAHCARFVRAHTTHLYIGARVHWIEKMWALLRTRIVRLHGDWTKHVCTFSWVFARARAWCFAEKVSRICVIPTLKKEGKSRCDSDSDDLIFNGMHFGFRIIGNNHIFRTGKWKIPHIVKFFVHRRFRSLCHSTLVRPFVVCCQVFRPKIYKSTPLMYKSIVCRPSNLQFAFDYIVRQSSTCAIRIAIVRLRLIKHACVQHKNRCRGIPKRTLNAVFSRGNAMLYFVLYWPFLQPK